MKNLQSKIWYFALAISVGITLSPLESLAEGDAPGGLGEEQLIIIEDGESPLEEGAPAAAGAEAMEPLDGSEGEQLLIIEDTPGEGSMGESSTTPEGNGELVIEESATVEEDYQNLPVVRSLDIKLDELWVEYGRFTDGNSIADNQGYLHGLAALRWRIDPRWEFQAEARVDGNYQWGGEDFDHTGLDYGDSFLRYSDDRWRLTFGADTVIWGRIDELPPTDRVSTVDLTRYILDDLSDRRRSTPLIRVERFLGNSKFDLVFLPVFRPAELPEEESVWYPLNRSSGQVFGVKYDPQLAALVENASYRTKAPDSDGGFGLRFSETRSSFDYALTVQQTRQSIPYFRFRPARNLIEAEYPRSWLVGGDIGFEAAGATWRLEAAWFSDTPVTETDNTYTTVESVSWGGGVEFYPGDGDARVNLQLVGMNMLNPPSVIDRTDIYALNGNVEVPFAHDGWRVKARFYVGLGDNDVYINPEIAYIRLEPHEFYLGGHYFNGADGTPGGFHEDNSLVVLGWRAHF
ncbi:MAG: hypothetical protein KDI63_17465 [Gammaproteobacteria bacterium]|nr:hypothetical protein [Gammaproteobacteria bacterium]